MMQPVPSQPLEAKPDTVNTGQIATEFSASEFDSAPLIDRGGALPGDGLDIGDILRAAPGVIRSAQEILKRVQEATDPANLAPRRKQRATSAGRKKPASQRSTATKTKTKTRAKAKPRPATPATKPKPKPKAKTKTTAKPATPAAKPKARPKAKPKVKPKATPATSAAKPKPKPKAKTTARPAAKPKPKPKPRAETSEWSAGSV